MFEWVKGNAYTMLVTLYPNNFTLNNVAAAYFEDIRWCCIGLGISLSHGYFMQLLQRDEI